MLHWNIPIDISERLRYLARYRVFIAADLLRHTDLSIQEVAFSAGFQDHAYFCRVFRKLCGMPPSCMRKTTLGDG
ncbi:MAG: helix-turn-helix transcriptional regulator [Treponema sp.]|jgi:transcriptional regulator GlxA family with amidase domain|nr:helix-turn-helix transcriptional regulator [Treponema sp.]